MTQGQKQRNCRSCVHKVVSMKIRLTLAAPHLEVGYNRGNISALEVDLGSGFLSPRGPASMHWMMEGADFSGCTVLDFGCG